MPYGYMDGPVGIAHEDPEPLRRTEVFGVRGLAELTQFQSLQFRV